MSLMRNLKNSNDNEVQLKKPFYFSSYAIMCSTSVREMASYFTHIIYNPPQKRISETPN